MMNWEIKLQKSFNYFFLVASCISVITAGFRSYYVPISHDEAATFFMYVQSGKFLPFHSQVDANNHVLNSALSYVCFHLFGSSPFSLRIPNLLALVILVFAIHRFANQLYHFGSKVFVVIAFLLSFHWLTFFSACRGYGISMGLLVLGLTYLFDYISNPTRAIYFYYSILLFQLAISANLILIIVVLVLSGILFLVQITNKQLLKPIIILVWLLHLAAVYYWLSFSFYLQDNGALYYGEGSSYWTVTFVSLIKLLLGYYHPFIKFVLLLLLIIILIVAFYINKNNLKHFKSQFKKPSASLLLLCVLGVLGIGFYLMNKVLDVNFPEDRTGLFFYVFFVLLIVFCFDGLSQKLNLLSLLPLSCLVMIHFFFNINFRKHSLTTYETIPEHFYTTLLNEQKNSKSRITIGGHRVRELFYAFFNYRNNGHLNPADPVEVMQMNCDYYIALENEQKYYVPYYYVIDAEPDWGFRLLKRKEPIIKKEFYKLYNKSISGNSEFMDVYHNIDTTLYNNMPLQAEINFDIDKITVPANTWIVFSVNDSLNNTYYFKRYPIQWMGYDNNGKKNISYTLTMGNIPHKAKNLCFFFWNIDQQPLSVKVNSLKLFQLEGKGVNQVAETIPSL